MEWEKTVEESLENTAESIQRHNWQADMHSKLIRIKKNLKTIGEEEGVRPNLQYIE